MTDITGTPVLHLQYLPFGEPWVRQINWNYALLHGESRYTFTGKERDEETGLMYFGARYYDPGRGIFTQVDPLHAKYPGLSSYNYCGNNPLKYVDPNGREPIKPQAGTASRFVHTLNTIGRQSGLKTGNVAHNAMLNFGRTEWTWKDKRPMPANIGAINKYADKYI
jgi:RHS repeat-associated protein